MSGSRYLPPERTSPSKLAREIADAAHSPVMDALLRSGAGAIAVVDEHRQLVAVNDTYLALIGAGDAAQVLGARPGEALACIHADEAPGGCGTCASCASCGLAVALLGASRGTVVERDCFVAARQGGTVVEHAFRVRASPFDLDGTRLTLVFLAEVSEERRRASVERAFLHDLANLAVGIRGAADELTPGAPAAQELCGDLHELAAQLVREVRLRRALASDELDGYTPQLAATSLGGLLRLARASLLRHPAAQGRALELGPVDPAATLVTDVTLVQHVLVNMLLNALEASRPGDVVRVAVEQRGPLVALRVWNPGHVPQAVVPRIFQRYFTTKGGAGRGQGTHAMKIFGEQLLGGRVSFTSSRAEGTWFELELGRDGARL